MIFEDIGAEEVTIIIIIIMWVVVEIVAEVEAPHEVLGSRESDTVSTCIRIVIVYFVVFIINHTVIDNW